MDLKIRHATPYDAEVLAPLMNQAGEGLPMVVWTQIAGPGKDPWEAGRDRIRGTSAGVSHRNAWVAVDHGETVACLIAYGQPEVPEPLPDDLPALFRPLAELEAEAPGTGYVYMLSTRPAAQGRGIGSRLLEHAEEHYRGPNGMSLIVSDANTVARNLYLRHGYRLAQTRPMVKEGWDNPGTEWHLMIKP